jgi:type I restriction enzyme M protein
MVDLTESTAEHGGRPNALDSDLIDEVAELYHRWVNGQQPKEEYAAVAAFDDLAGNDFVIDPGRYLSLAHAAPDLDEAARTRSELADRLESLTESSRDADAKLQAILGARR